MKIIKPSVSLNWITKNAEEMIERIGRVCYKSEEKITSASSKKFIQQIIKSGHLSVIEHASASFHIICDRGITHEIVRHRLASYSQESTRFCNYSKDKFEKEITVIEPTDLDTIGKYQKWFETLKHCESVYMWMIDKGVKPQIARSILPNCLKTEIHMTCNFREWMHFLSLRTSEKAHPQMREVAFMIKKILVVHCPTIFGED